MKDFARVVHIPWNGCPWEVHVDFPGNASLIVSEWTKEYQACEHARRINISFSARVMGLLKEIEKCPHGCTDGNCPWDRKLRTIKDSLQ